MATVNCLVTHILQNIFIVIRVLVDCLLNIYKHFIFMIPQQTFMSSY